MGKKSKKNTSAEDQPANPEDEAKRVITSIKNYKQPVFAQIVDFCDDPNYVLLTKCLELVRKDQNPAVQNCSILLISAGKSDVLAKAYSNDPEKISTKEWVESALSTLQKEGNLTLSDDTTAGRIKVSSEAFPIKEKETALANSFQYLHKIGAMPKDEESSEEMEFNLNDF
jgi:hypothetical protein